MTVLLLTMKNKAMEGIIQQKIPSDIGPKIWIPRWNLFGWQPPKEYTQVKRKLVRKAFSQDPLFLNKEPALTCLVPYKEDQSRIIVLDGHHRVRESGRIRIKNGKSEELLYKSVPIRIFSPEEAADLLNRSGRYRLGNNGKHPWTKELLIEDLNEDVNIALGLFQEQMPDFKSPQPLIGISSIQQLQQEFGQPPYSYFG